MYELWASFKTTLVLESFNPKDILRNGLTTQSDKKEFQKRRLETTFKNGTTRKAKRVGFKKLIKMVILVTLDIFFGRPNPTWELTDEQTNQLKDKSIR